MVYNVRSVCSVCAVYEYVQSIMYVLDKGYIFGIQGMCAVYRGCAVYRVCAVYVECAVHVECAVKTGVATYTKSPY